MFLLGGPLLTGGDGYHRPSLPYRPITEPYRPDYRKTNKKLTKIRKQRRHERDGRRRDERECEDEKARHGSGAFVQAAI